MDAQSVSSILNPTPQPTTSASTPGGALGKEDFLKMLTAQLQYQNPLDPMNDQEFVAQMAQFSSLEQLENMNTTLTQNAQYNMLLSQTINNTMATSLIGRTVTADTNAVGISGGGGTSVTFNAASFALNGTITISDSNGNVVRTLTVNNLPAGNNSVKWDGKDDKGNQVPDGSYTYSVSLTDTSGASVTASTFTTGTVAGVKYISGQAYLLIDGAYIPLSDIREIKQG